jgi:hypothetical protein
MFNGILGEVISADFEDRYGPFHENSAARLASARGEETGKVIVSEKCFEKFKTANPDAGVPEGFQCEFAECNDSDISFRTDT